MPKSIKFLSKEEQIQAMEEMLREQLLFFPEDAVSQIKLKDYLKKQGNRPDFHYLPTEYDKHVIIASIPNLGPNQLGVFAGKTFKKGEIVGEVKGADLFGIHSNAKIERIVEAYQGDATFIWKLNLEDDDDNAVVIDMLEKGSSTRWVNHANKPNLKLKVIYNQIIDDLGRIQNEYHAYYVAAKNIAFAEELTISYGDEYFTEERPEIWHKSQTLIEILLDLAKIKGLDIKAFELDSPAAIKEVFEQLVLQEEALQQDRKQIYLDKNLDPKIYDLHKYEDIARLQKNEKMHLKSNSPFHLVIAPTLRQGEYRYSLFSCQEIPAKKTICQLVGKTREDVPAKEREMESWAMQQNLDINYLVPSGEGGYLYTKEISSEAYCIEGAKFRSEMNVRFDFATNSYISTRYIQPGEEILAYYKNYDYGASPVLLCEVIADFNESQYYYHANWDGNNITMDYVIPKTPGYNLDFEEELDSIQTGATADSSEGPFSPFDGDNYERILTPGSDLGFFEEMLVERSDESAERHESGDGKRKSNWSPNFSFGEPQMNKRRKNLEDFGDQTEVNSPIDPQY